MEIGLKGNLLPTCEADFADNAIAMRYLRCICCNAPFSSQNTQTRLGWRETQISGFCEACFDDTFKDE
jgi:hypothetical protein